MRVRYAPLVLALVACTAGSPAPPAPEVDWSKVEVAPVAPTLRRLTHAQYENTVHSLVGDTVVVPDALEPDDVVEGLASIGASRGTISPLGVERYEKAALSISEQVFADPAMRATVVPCTPVKNDETCLSNFANAFGLRALRRPLEADERARFVGIGKAAAEALGDPWQGPRYVMAAILQSPNFLFRTELGEPDPDHPGARRYTSLEMATRLSYFLSNTTPDDTMLTAGAAGLLVTDQGIREQAERLIASAAGRQAVRAFFTELYHLDALDKLSKDPKVFTQMSADLGPAAREQTLSDLERIVFDEDADFRTFFTGRKTRVDRRLAAIYGVPVRALDGFSEVVLPEAGGRRGFLGQVSFLALQSHPTTSSAVQRGKFVRQVLLCGIIPPPPANVNTGLPDPGPGAQTLRQRSEQHMTNESCRACHATMDPIGLGFENFDGLGKYRKTEAGAVIDPSGDLDGVAFGGPVELGDAIANHPMLAPCLVRNLYRYAAGHVEEAGELATLDTLSRLFTDQGHRVKPLLVAIVTSPAFRTASEPTP